LEFFGVLPVPNPDILAEIVRKPGQNPDEVAQAEENFQKIALAQV
jgi:hypothetical protein